MTKQASVGEQRGGDAAPDDMTMASMRVAGRRLAAYAAVIAVVSIGVGLVTYLVRASEPDTYEAVSRFSITPNDKLLNGTAADLVESVAALDRPIVNATVSELLQSGAVAEDAAGAIGLSTADLDEYDFVAAEVPGAAVVRLSITGPDPTVVEQLSRAVRETDFSTAREFGGVFDVQSIDRATVEVAQVAPTPERDAVAAALAAAVALGALAVLFDARLRRSRANASAGSDSHRATAPVSEMSRERSIDAADATSRAAG